MNIAEPHQQKLRGIILLVLSATAFAVVDGLSKSLAETQPVVQIVWARYTLSLPVLLAVTPLAEWRRLLRTTRPGRQLIRGIAPLGVSFSMVMAVHYLPLAETTVILFAGPFLVVALSGPLLGERVRLASWIGVAVGFAAVVLVARPGFSEVSEFLIYPAVAAVLFAAFQLATRWVRASGESASTTMAWTLAVGIVVVTPMAIATWQAPTATTWLLLISLGLVFGLAQVLMVHAFAHASASFLAPFGYSQIVAAVIVGVLAFGAVPDGLTLLGVAMVIGAGIYVARVPVR